LNGDTWDPSLEPRDLPPLAIDAEVAKALAAVGNDGSNNTDMVKERLSRTQ
jgi:hypothetical protein